ncbi:MAG: bifunctional DNA primase/polymerase, partial [Rhodospirillaceae bacterium]|nr:bifunctional DNA primase/polymerase [Rhodospirillaceae bacterium]
MNADKIDTQNGGNILVPSSNDNQEIDNGFLLAAQSYREKGWSIIPLQACEKVPDLRTWTSFQETAASEETISRWWEAKSNRNVGIVTGQVSGLIVLDVDGSDGEESLAMLGQVPTTPTVRTARGHHYYFKHPGGKLPIFAGRRPGIDFRGDGGYIVAPPSVHPDGSIYEWVVSPNDTPLADAPDWLLELVAEKGRPSGSGGRDLRSSVNDNESAGPQINYLGNGTFENVEMVYPGNVHGMELLLTAKAAYWNHHHYRDDIRTLLMSRSTAIEAVVNLAFEALARSEQGANWDRDQECETVTKMYDDAVNNWSAEWEAGSSSAKQGTARAQLIELTDGFEVWHTPNQEPFIKVPVGSHHENLRIDGNSFSYWLSREHYGRHKTSPSRQALEEATHQIIGHARFDGAEAPVHLRLGEHQGSIWIDLGNEDWSAVKVTSNGWRVFADAPIHFRRTAGMESLPIPVAGGSLDDLRPFLNVGTEDQFKFLVGWLLGALRPTGPFPILVINGEQGSGKSTLARVMRMLVDPNTLPIRSKPRGEQDLYIAANNGWVISLDNLSSVNDWLSDCLCRLATGGGFSTRKLYSDDDEILINVTCPIVINGIPDL